MSQYTMVIQWSDEDQLFLVTIPEFSGLAKGKCYAARYHALYTW